MTHSVRRTLWATLLCLVLALLGVAATPAHTDPLGSWNDGSAKRTILSFVEASTREGASTYVSPHERIAVFDNDGTLWPEQPMYVQLRFAMDRVNELAPRHPEWSTTQPFQAALEGDLATLAASGHDALAELVAATHTGNTPEEFRDIVRSWLATARHPDLDRPYTELAYQPMLELLDLLRANDFETYIVTGGGVEFVRAWAEEVYGIPPERVIGSSVAMRYEGSAVAPRLVRLPEIDFVDDGPGKPVGIQRRIGRRPVAAFGNSDGDFEMLEWVTTAPGPTLGLLVHHDDARREWAYDRESTFGRLGRALDEAPRRGWLVASVKDDWKRVFRFER